MIFIKFYFFILVACTPKVIEAQKKLILLMPRNVKRAQGSPWRQLVRSPMLKSTHFHDNEFLSSHQSKVYIPFHHGHKGTVRYTKKVPHGGDDFDQGHEEVNHVYVPHGKGITHAITFGQGYVPHDALVHHAGFPSASSHHEAADESLSYNTLTPLYITPQVTHQADSYLNDDDDYTIQDRKIDDVQMKFLKAKSIARVNLQSPGKIIVHHGPIESNGNKAIIIKDTINFDEYNKRVAELTKSWPMPGQSALPTGTFGIISSKPHDVSAIPELPQLTQLPQLQQLQPLQPLHSQPELSVANYPAPSNIITSINLNPRHGYAVKEEIQDIPHDFRTMPIHTASNQLPVTSNLHVVQPLTQSVSQISAPTTSVPGYYALSGYHNILQG